MPFNSVIVIEAGMIRAVSRHAAIYCRGKARQVNRAAVEALRSVASREGWTVVGAFVDESERTELEYNRLWRGIAAHDIDLLAIPSFTALADGVAGVLAEILRLRDAGCDLYLLEPNLNTESPVDRILFPIAAALKEVGDVAEQRRVSERRVQRVSRRHFTPTLGQTSLIRAALSAGLTPRAIAKSLKMPLGLVETVVKSERQNSPVGR